MENKKISSYKELIVWQKSMSLVEDIYKIVKELPIEEKFGFVSQITRSVISIPSNIAEGSGRGTRKEYVQFLKIARGSIFELETQISLLNRLYGLQTDKLLTQATEISKILNTIIKKLES